jgi:hypothetical protein
MDRNFLVRSAFRSHRLVRYPAAHVRVRVVRMVPRMSACYEIRLTTRWSERRTAVRFTFEMTSTHSLRATRVFVRRRSSCSR